MPPEDDDLTGLSDTERAALLNETEDETALKAIAGKTPPAGDDTVVGAGADAEGDEDADEDETDPAAKATKDAAAAAAQATADAAAKAADKTADTKIDTKAPVAEQPAVVFTATAPEDAEDQIKALRAEKAGFFKQLMDGELTPEEYSAKEDAIVSKISGIEREVTTATVATKLTLENAQRSYLGKVNALLDRAAKDEGIDYRGNAELNAALDRTVKWLASDPANADKPEQWFLDEAHTLVKTRFGLAKPATADAGAGAGAGKTNTGGKAPALDGLPPSLRNAPAASSADDGGEFSHLSALNGMALERALAKLSPEQQARYLEA